MSQNIRAGDRRRPGPGQQLEGLGVGHGQHVALLDPAEPVDGRAVEGHALLEGVLELGRGDVEVLGRAEHVGEPQLDEADAALLDGPQHVVLLAFHAVAHARAGAQDDYRSQRRDHRVGLPLDR